MKKLNLTLVSLAGLVRTSSVRRVWLTPYPAIDGGGWCVDVDHADHGLTRELHTQRGRRRVFRTADAAIAAVRDSGYTGTVQVRLSPPEGH